jgi:hypothetical protein
MLLFEYWTCILETIKYSHQFTKDKLGIDKTIMLTECRSVNHKLHSNILRQK